MTGMEHCSPLGQETVVRGIVAESSLVVALKAVGVKGHSTYVQDLRVGKSRGFWQRRHSGSNAFTSGRAVKAPEEDCSISIPTPFLP